MTLTEHEKQFLILAIDTLVRQTGLKHAQNAVVMLAKINKSEPDPEETSDPLDKKAVENSK